MAIKIIFALRVLQPLVQVILKPFVSPYESTVSSMVFRGIFIGKTNLDEFAMGSSAETSVFGVTSNPWDVNRVPEVVQEVVLLQLLLDFVQQL